MANIQFIFNNGYAYSLTTHSAGDRSLGVVFFN